LTLLRVADDRIVDARGDPVYLRGFQGVEFYSVDTDWYFQATLTRGEDPAQLDRYAIDLHRYTLTDFDLREFRAVGANVVRLWFQLHEIEKRPYRYSETALALLEATVNAFGEQGICHPGIGRYRAEPVRGFATLPQARHGTVGPA